MTSLAGVLDQPQWRRDDARLASDEGDIASEIRDLLDVASTAFIVDRTERRGTPGESDWHRSLMMTAYVRNLDLWRSPTVQPVLQELLCWLTGDDWSVRFEKMHREDACLQARIPLMDPPDDVVLFSGGLDATAGVASLMERGRSVLAVGVVTNGTMAGYQRKVHRALLAGGRKSLDYVGVSLESTRGTRHDEPSRRTRGLNFLAIGVASARSVGLDRLLMLENGIGAINLPYTAAQWGAMTSRAAHPRTLQLMEHLVTLLLERPFKIENPHLGETKGEMCAKLPAWAETACAASESCDNAAAGRGELQRRCGECTSCLLRRVSFAAADRSDWDRRPYLADISGARSGKDRAAEMLWQVARLDHALADADSGALDRAFPALREVPIEILSPRAQRRLLSAYVDEWRRYPDRRVSRYVASGHQEHASHV